MTHKKPCKILAILLLTCVLCPACGLDKGSSGDLPPQNVFLEAEGCLGQNPDEFQIGTIQESFSITIPFTLELMEARLEVTSGEMDLIVGTEKPPSDYFSFGRGPGTQKILVGRDSREPMQGRPWYVNLISPYAIQEECEAGDDPDWRLTVRRSTGIQGRVLLDQEYEVPACTPGNCETIEIEVPEDALSMEFALESLEGDADLLVGFGDETESLVSLNPGTGYDVVVLDPEACVPLRGQSLSVVLESRRQLTQCRLQVAYTAGEPEQPAPAGEAPG